MRRNLFLILLSVFVLIVSGCLDAKKYSDISYDAKTDTFRMLRVYYHINSAEKDDLTYLVNMSMNRESILPMDVIGFLVESAQLRVDAKSYYQINLGAMAEKPKEPTAAKYDLSKIVNKPGKFFLAGENSLGYYHQLEIPGAVVDQVVVSVNEEMLAELSKSLVSELDRRKNGGVVKTWDAIRDEMIKQIGGGPLPARGTEEEVAAAGKAPFNVLSEDSIKLIQKGIADKKIGFARKGSEFSIAMPATAEDRKGFMGLRDTIKNELAKAMEADPKDTKNKMVIDILDAVSIVNDEKSGQIATSADYVKVRKALGAVPGTFDLTQRADPAKAAAMTGTIAALKDAKVEIDETIKLEEIPAMWEKGTLPVWKADKAVEVGTGMFKAPASMPSSGPRVPTAVPKD
jgi:hypothetical protein